MSVFCIALDPQTEQFYRRLADAVRLPVERVLSDALFKLAGELALEALARTDPQAKEKR